MLIAGCIIPVADPGASIPRLVASKCRKNRHISTALPHYLERFSQNAAT
jgi:hypothetical protein